jgi:hypothetical protein
VTEPQGHLADVVRGLQHDQRATVPQLMRRDGAAMQGRRVLALRERVCPAHTRSRLASFARPRDCRTAPVARTGAADKAKRRSMSVNRARDGIRRRSTFSQCRRMMISASSRRWDLNSATRSMPGAADHRSSRISTHPRLQGTRDEVLGKDRGLRGSFGVDFLKEGIEGGRSLNSGPIRGALIFVFRRRGSCSVPAYSQPSPHHHRLRSLPARRQLSHC